MSNNRPRQIIWRLGFACLAVCAGTTIPAGAASPEKDNDCAAIASNIERLECYDQASKEAGVADVSEKSGDKGKTGSQANPYGGWQIDVRKSLMDDSDIVLLRLNAEQTIKGAYGIHGRPALFIACNEGEVSLWIRFGSYVTDFYSGGQVSYRLDEAEVRQVEMRESHDQKALGLWGGLESLLFIREIADAKRLVVRAMPRIGYQVTISFDLTGIDLALKPLEKACSDYVESTTY